MKYSKFPCADHSNEPLKAEIVCASGLHDFLSFISIAQKETFHIPLWELWIGGYRTVFAIGNLLRKALIYFEWNLIEVVDKWK